MTDKKCKHPMYGSYSFDVMRPPFCISCGKPKEGEDAKAHLDYYQSIIDEWNEKAQKKYDKGWDAAFFVKSDNGSYYLKSKRKPKTSILGILKDVFIDSKYYNIE